MAAMFLIAAVIGVAEGYVIRRQIDSMQAEAASAWEARLGAQAEELSRAVAAWAGHVQGDAKVLSAFPAIRGLAAPAGAANSGQRDPATRRAHAVEVLDSFIGVHGYLAAIVLDGSGAVVGAAGDQAGLEELPALLASTDSRDVMDFFQTSRGPVIAFGARLEDRDSMRGGGCVVVLVDPRHPLHGRLLRPPAPAESGETVLLGVQRGRPVYFTPLRHLTAPVSTHGFPAASDWARNGHRLQRRGPTDYRGEPVLVASRAVDGTPWTVASKIDRAEASTILASAGVRGTGIVALAAAAQLLLVFGLLRRRQALHARQQREAAEKLRFLNALYRTLSETDEMMVREKDRQRLLDETCRIIVERAGFRMAWIGEPGPDGRVVPVAQAGDVRGYLDDIEIRIDSSPAGQGPGGTAIRDRRTVVVHDIAASPEMAPWRTGALARGYRAVAGVPLVAGERRLGVLLVYAGDRRLLEGEAVPLVEKLASSLAYSLDVVDLEARHRETTLALSASEEQLRQAQKMEAIGRLAGGIAHDFNNLLMVISGYADLALSPKLDDERRRRSVEEIVTAAERATELTRQLVAFSRKQVLQPKVLNFNELVRRVEKLLHRLLPENIVIEVKPETTLLSVRADPSQMEQVLLNLALNARDAMPGGGRLSIETANLTLPEPLAVWAGELAGGDYVVVRVCDTGDGILPEAIEHLFEPFFTTKETGKGTGLGLSMVYGIIQQSGGGIAVETFPGRGTTFLVYLPALALPAPAPESIPAVQPTGRGHEAVLVVEDNEAVRGFVSESLREAGYAVTESDSPTTALAMLASASQEFDLLLTDLLMPDMDGYELARRASAARPSLRVLYMTGYSDNPKLRQDALITGVDLLEKPFSAAALAAKVREVLDRRQGAGTSR